MGRDYDTVGVFYERLGQGLRSFVGRYGESIAFDGDPALQLSPEEVSLRGARHVRCLKTALGAFSAIIEQGEGAPRDSATGKTDMLDARDGVVAIDPQLNGPLRARGNLEILSGTGRAVARVTSAYLCRCGGSANKPFCDSTHAKIGFKSGRDLPEQHRK